MHLLAAYQGMRHLHQLPCLQLVKPRGMTISAVRTMWAATCAPPAAESPTFSEQTPQQKVNSAGQQLAYRHDGHQLQWEGLADLAIFETTGVQGDSPISKECLNFSADEVPFGVQAAHVEFVFSCSPSLHTATCSMQLMMAGTVAQSLRLEMADKLICRK